ncbi:MAG: PEGA domain-containing protein [Vicinamibacterales bacterium]
MRSHWRPFLVFSAAVLLSTSPAWAQDAQQRRPEGRPEGRPAGGGERAVPREGGDGGSTGRHTPSAPAYTPPPPDSGSSSGSGDTSSRRRGDGSGSGAGSGYTRSRRGSDDGDSNRIGAVPSYSRPRGDRPNTGVAEYRDTPVRGTSGGYYYYSPYSGYRSPYYTWGYVPYGFGTFGMGYFYDPYSWGAYDPYGYGGYGYGGYGYGGYGYGGGYPSGPSYGGQNYSYRERGAIRLRLKPRNAQVYVDGYYVGTVDEFDGTFQSLKLEEGVHRIEVKADGFETLSFEVRILPDQKIVYDAELRRR